MSEFNKCSQKVDGKQSHCRPCRQTYTKAYDKKNPDRKLLKLYGITAAAKALLLKEQGGRCAVCRTKNWGTKGPCVDHCHATGKVRGILCSKCNLGLGILGDTEDGLVAALNYIRG